MNFERLCPNPNDIQTGDLLWPRAEGQYVPFHDPRVQQAMHAMQAAGEMHATARMEAFTRSIWCGHVAFALRIDGALWVIDATPHRSRFHTPASAGVAMQPYEDFLGDKDHLGSHIWHGRVPGITAEQRSMVAKAAMRYLGAPYSFKPWGFDSTTDFYCSKFVWHVLRDALGIELLGGPDQLPQPWFTPWDVMQSAEIERLFEPEGKSYRG